DNLSPEQIMEARAKLIGDPHVMCVFTSPTATGLKAVFAVAGGEKEHAGNFRAVKNHVAATTGLSVDESCKNIERLCFVSPDPDAHLNLAAEPLPPVAEERPVARAPVSGPPEIETR